MPITPFSIVWLWLRGLIAIAILAGGIALLRGWYDRTHGWEVESRPVAIEPRRTPDDAPRTAPVAVESTPRRWVSTWTPGLNAETAMLAGGLALLATALAGRLIVQGLARLVLRTGPDEPNKDRGGEVREIPRPDGTVLRVECYGPADAPPIVFTHGWGADATEWYYVKKHLAGPFRVIVWDLPGLGLSRKPDNNDYRLDKLADDLDAVVALAGGRPALLVGHSIGGMITLVYARRHAAALGQRVAGLALVHTTYTDPIRTMKHAEIKTALEGPVVTPLLHLTIALWPLVWAMNWLAYLNGSFHRSTHKDSFAGHETRGQLDFAASFLPHARPDVLARGMFGMMRFDESETLPNINVPTLVIPADRDVTCLPEASERMARDIPGSTLTPLSPAKHMGLIEHHARFNELVGDFARTCHAVASPASPA